MEKQYYITREQYLSLKAAWNKLATEKAITPQDIFTYNILRSRLPTRGFSPASGGHIRCNDPWYAFNTSKSISHASAVGGESSPEYTERKAKRFSERFGMQCPEDLRQKILEVPNE